MLPYSFHNIAYLKILKVAKLAMSVSEYVLKLC